MAIRFPKKDIFSKTHVTVLVPSTKGKYKPISNKQFAKRVEDTKNIMEKTFGGTTEIDATGSYVLDNGKIIREDIASIESFIRPKDFTRKNIQNLYEYLKNKRKQWGQESLALKFESPKRTAEELHLIV